MVRTSAQSVSLLPPSNYPARKLALILMVLAPFAFGALALALGQDANWDLRNYHWYNGYAFLTGRTGTDLLPSQIPWFYNPALDVPFYLLASHVPACVVGFVLGFIQGLNFPLLFMLAHAALAVPNPRHKVLVCAALASLGMLGGGAISLLGTTFYDNITSLGIFGSMLLVLRHADDMAKASWLRAFLIFCLVGLPAGLMTGLKLPAMIFSFGLCGALLFTTGPIERRIWAAFAFGIGILIGAVITQGYWAWHLQSHFGNPFFPYFNEFFKSPLEPLISERDQEYVTHGFNETILLPFIFALHPQRVGEIDWRDWGIPILYALLPVAALLRMLFGRSRQTPTASASPFAARYLLMAAVLSYAAWLKMFCIYRYAVPLEMLAPLLIVLAAGLLPLKPSPRAMLTAFILLIVAASIQPGTWHRRANWLDHFVEADVPKLGDTKDLMILMAGYEPYSHLIPEFPPEISFVRIQSNFTQPGDGKGFGKLIHDKVAAHKGRMMILIPPWQHGLAQDALHAYGLSGQWNACQTVVDRLYDDNKFDLCPVTKAAHG